MLERRLTVLLAGALLALSSFAHAQPALERLTFDEAVRHATEHNPTVAEAALAIERAKALRDESRANYFPTLYANAGTTVLDDQRGFDGNITQPRVQTVFNATATFPFLAVARWANHARLNDQIGIARISAEDVRRQVAIAAAQAYLAVVTAEHARDIALRNLETAKALGDYAHARLEAGQGSRLNYLRSAQEQSSAEALLGGAELAVRRAQEALGVAVFIDGPVDANGDPEIRAAALPPAGDEWLLQRPDVRLTTAQLRASERVVRDNWKSWLPEGTFSFQPQYVTPKGFFEPAKTWRAFFGLQIPIYDGTLGASKRLKLAERESARLRLDSVRLQARSELRVAQEEVQRQDDVTAARRRAAASALDVLRISEIAYRAGATSNIEVVQAQQGARATELESALANERLHEARLNLLVALGQFP